MRKSLIVKFVWLRATVAIALVPAFAASLAGQDPAGPAKGEVATGVVFHDTNGNSRLDPQDFPIKGVRVSNGLAIVKTDEAGRYQLPITNDSPIFVIKPSGFRTKISDLQLPQFYYMHKKHGSPDLRYPGIEPTGELPDSIDFPLSGQLEPSKFEVILFGDTQARNLKEVDYIAKDVVSELVGRRSAFGVTLGDIVFDDLDLFQPHNAAVALVGIPWYNVIGNHDINFDAQTREHANETFERHYGPSWYSFDYGQVHFVVMDNINWIVEENGSSRYVGGFGDRQLAFLENDLALIPENQMVVLLMHIPLNEVEDREQLYRLIENRPLSLSISGHTHFQEHRFIDREDGWRGPQPHHHVVNVTVSGSWWSGNRDERGIPHTTMRDGAPNGFSLLTFDGNRYQLDFRAAGRSADYQMNIVTTNQAAEGREVNAPLVAGELTEAQIWVNVFNGSPKCQVEVQVDDTSDWQKLDRVVEPDPLFVQTWNREQQVVPVIEPKLSKPIPSSHLWRGAMPHDLAAGTHLIRARWTDYNGKVTTAFQVIRIDSPTAN